MIPLIHAGKVLQGSHQFRFGSSKSSEKLTHRPGRCRPAMPRESLRPDKSSPWISTCSHVNGLEATELIMCQHPRPIVIVSSENKDEEQAAAHALALGAIDLVPKPSGAPIGFGYPNHRRRA